VRFSFTYINKCNSFSIQRQSVKPYFNVGVSSTLGDGEMGKGGEGEMGTRRQGERGYSKSSE